MRFDLPPVDLKTVQLFRIRPPMFCSEGGILESVAPASLEEMGTLEP